MRRSISGGTGDHEGLCLVTHDRRIVLQEVQEIALDGRLIRDLLFHLEAGERADNIAPTVPGLPHSHRGPPHLSGVS